MEIMKEASFLQAMVCQYFGYWSEALKYFKNARNIADELGSQDEKKLAYRNMGKCYQEMKNFKCAVRAFKKLLEIAW